jgi:hypothetical protein
MGIKISVIGCHNDLDDLPAYTNIRLTKKLNKC